MKSGPSSRKRINLVFLAIAQVCLLLGFNNCGPAMTSFVAASDGGQTSNASEGTVSTPAPSATPVSTPIPTPTPMPTPRPTATPLSTATPLPTATPRASATPTPTPASTPAPTPTPAAAGSSPTLGTEIAAGATLGGNQYQTDLRVNPTVPSQWSITMKTAFSETSTALVNTQDSGKTWTSTTQASSGDPDVAYDLLDNAYWSFIDKSAGNQIGVRKSADGGKTWGAKTVVSITVDHPHIIVDRTLSAYTGSIYVIGRNFSANGISLAYSRDQGLTWNTQSIDLGNSALNTGFVYGPVIGKDGTLYIPYEGKQTILAQNGVFAGATDDMYLLRSTDGGKTVTKSYIGPQNTPASSGAGGFFGLGNLGIGPLASGERLYFSYVQKYSGAPSRLMLATSDDRGMTWSTPKAIDTPVTGSGAGSCSIMVNSAGVIGVQYYSIESNSNSFDMRFVYSKDQGATFSAPVRITTQTSTNTNNVEPRYFGQDQVYSDVSPDGVFHLVWTDDRVASVNYTVYTRSVTVP